MIKTRSGDFFYICFTFIFIFEKEDYFMSQKLMCFISKLSAILGFLWETYINLKLHHWGMLIPNINTDTSCSEQQHEKASKTCETLTMSFTVLTGVNRWVLPNKVSAILQDNKVNVYTPAHSWKDVFIWASFFFMILIW